MRESQIEGTLVRRVNELGGLALKFVSPGRRGVPDRLVILPGGRVAFVEVKAPGGRLLAGQQRVHQTLRHLGVEVVVLWSIEEVAAWLA